MYLQSCCYLVKIHLEELWILQVKKQKYQNHLSSVSLLFIFLLKNFFENECYFFHRLFNCGFSMIFINFWMIFLLFQNIFELTFYF